MPTELERRARKGCTCEGCGQDYYGDLIVPDEVWAEIADSRELLCGTCITDAIVLRGIWTAARVTDIDALQAQQPGAQAVAFRMNIGGEWIVSTTQAGLEFVLRHAGTVADIERLYTHPQPPSIPEPSWDVVNDEDLRAAKDAALRLERSAWAMDRSHAIDDLSAITNVIDALTNYTARLRERIGGGG